MDHLFSSVVRVERLQLSLSDDGTASMEWQQATDPDQYINWQLGWLACRLDMSFVRPGKDIAPAPEAGKAPDRIGVMFVSPDAPIRAGDRIVAIENELGRIVVKGTFEIRYIPDEAVDYDSVHHIEVQIIETNQNLEGNIWPDEEALPNANEIPTLPEVTDQPTPTYSFGSPGDPISYFSEAAGVPVPTVQWQMQQGATSQFEVIPDIWENIPDATNTTFDARNIGTFGTQYAFRAVFSNGSGYVASATVWHDYLGVG